MNPHGPEPPGPPSAAILSEPLPPDPDAGARQRSVAILMLGSLLFGVMALLVKKAAVHLPGPEVAFLRFVIGLLAVGVAVLRGRRMRPRSHWALFFRGAFGGAAVLLYFLAIARLSVGVATLLNYSSPLFTGIFSAIFLREGLGPRTILALGLTSAGVVLVVEGGAPQGLLGSAELPYVLVGCGSAVLSGAAVTTIRAMRQREGSWEIFLAFCLVGGALTAVPAGLSWVRPSAADLGYVLGVGLVSVAAQICLTHALRDVRAATAGLIMQLTPAAAFVLGMLFLGERPTGLALCGAALTLVGVSWGVATPSAGGHHGSRG